MLPQMIMTSLRIEQWGELNKSKMMDTAMTGTICVYFECERNGAVFLDVVYIIFVLVLYFVPVNDPDIRIGS